MCPCWPRSWPNVERRPPLQLHKDARHSLQSERQREQLQMPREREKLDFASTLPHRQCCWVTDSFARFLRVDVYANASLLRYEIAIQRRAKTNWVEIREHATERLKVVHNLHRHRLRRTTRAWERKQKLPHKSRPQKKLKGILVALSKKTKEKNGTWTVPDICLFTPRAQRLGLIF